jgi:hypothetical protein
MSSARQFCRVREYPVAVFLTYSFDPLFFERISWADLGIGGSRRIVIAADAGQVADAMRRCVGQLAHLGRRYVLAETAGADLFHPKLIARLSEKGGRVWVASGNLTYTGWGANRELATSWPIGPDEDDKGEWLDEALGTVGTLTQSTSFTDQLRAIREEIPWLTAHSSPQEKPPVLLGMRQRPLAPQLADRWRGRRFDNLLLCTGSTDVEGEFLAWAHRVFGIRRATVCLNPAYASFDPARLAKLPLDVRIIAAAPEQYMHAKFYWFSGAEGNAAVVGSANCSAAAWLGGNVELVVPYDEARAANFEAVLPIFKMKGETPQKVLTAKPADANRGSGSAPGYRIVSVRLRSARVVEALLDPPPATDAQINLVITGASGTTVIQLTAQSRGLGGQLPHQFELGLLTPFAYAEGVSGGIRFTTDARWIDNDTMLERVSRAPLLDPNLQDLSRRSLFRSSHHRIMEAVQVISAQLLTPRHDERAGQQARSVGAKFGAKPDLVQMPVAVNPSAMIRSLNDLKQHHRSRTRFSDHGASLGGVIGMLFAQEDQPDAIDLTRETWSASEPEKNPDEPEQPSETPPPPSEPETPSGAAVSLETRTAFQAEIETFLHELAKPAFAETCDANRMVQALAFPLLLCVRGGEAGWILKSELASVAARVAEIMFDRFYGRDRPRGLFAVVHDRYLREGRLDDFRRALGDGTLWAALLAALSIDPDAAPRVVVRQAAALAAVFRSGELLAAVSEPAQLSALVRSLLIANAERQITERAEKIARAADALVALLSDRWDALFEEQGRGRRLQPGNALLWSRTWGWLVTPGKPAQSYYSDHICLEAAAAAHPDIQEAVARVFEACRY